MDRKYVVSALIAAMFISGCGGGGGSDSETVDTGNTLPDTSSPVEETSNRGQAEVTKRSSVLAESFSYDGNYDYVSVSGKAFDPMEAEMGNAFAASCDGMSDRYYDNGLVRAYSDGGVTDEELKQAGDQARGTLEMTLTASGLTIDDFQQSFFSTLHPKAVREILDYAESGVPVNWHDGAEWGVIRSAIHNPVISFYDLLDEDEMALFEAGEHVKYRDLIESHFMAMQSWEKMKVLVALQEALVTFAEFDPDAPLGGGGSDDAVGEPDYDWSWGPEPVINEEMAANPEYAALFDNPAVDPVVNVCVLSENNTPDQFDAEVGINSVTFGTGTDNVEVGKAMAKVIGLHLATTYRYDYVQAMPFWFTEGMAFSLIVTSYDKVDADTLVEQDALNNFGLAEESYASIVEGLEADKNTDFLMNLYYAQRFIPKADGDSTNKGFSDAFAELVQAPNHPDLTYQSFKDNFGSIMASLL
ncbi:hypothetical protein [Marinobacter salicampi]|uniref:hypothetical protein n=1 Tax=Marinobacter salicampi TaxID=435907 RepID=UPI00140BA01F|nr:hypothetical protein [Marinobacter salicampi]